MSGQMWVWVVLAGLAVLLWAERAENSKVKAVAKPIASTAFIAEAVAFGAGTTRWGQVLLVALAFCWLGDVLLLSRKDKLFLGGLVAFLLGHVGYAVMFVMLGLDTTWLMGGGVFVLVVLPIVAKWVLPNVKGSMKGPVVAYMVVISAMVALAAGCAGHTDRLIFLVAAVMFFVSDLAVARDRFVSPGFPNRLWGLPLYYVAQILFAATPGSP
ncbi:MAG: lysoplasmalogenase [Deltaproteobacteria bacterium]|nr:lysoplasmalogenase [Deltaproteobacteria bacterium]